MDKFTRFLFSMRMMAVGMTIFLVAIAVATFLESAYDVQTAKIIIYNALWFEVLLAYLCISLIANIFSYRMYQREKIAMLMFHVAFIVMIIGAAITRFVGFEGMMMIREGQTVDFIYTSDPYFWFSAKEGDVESTPYAEKMYMSEITDNYFKLSTDLPGHKQPITVEYVNFRKKLVDSLVVNDSIRGTALEIVTNGRQSNYVSEGDFLMIGPYALSFEDEKAGPGIQVTKSGAQLLMKTSAPMRSLAMTALRQADQVTGPADSLYVDIPADTVVPFESGRLYMIEGEQFMFRDVIKHAKMMRMPSGRKDVGEDCLTVKVTDGEHSRVVDLSGGFGALPEHMVFEMNGVSYQMEYGSMKVRVPFSIRCNDFQLDRYPGSDAPSSFASEVTVIDEEMGVTKNKRIFMNHVMDYRGYRFFQSGYDPDEGGTRLSVSHDWWGTTISYLGYLMMGIGMLLSFFAYNGRFRELNRKLGKSVKEHGLSVALLAGMTFAATSPFAQHTASDGHDHGQTEDPIYRTMSEEHSDELASLLVSLQGRIVPFHSLCDQLLRKISRDNSYEDLNAVQTIMSMHMYQGYWVRQPIIYVSSKSDLREKLGMKGDKISYADLTDLDKGEFKLAADYNKAHQKPESMRGEYDKRILQLGERYQVMGMIFRWDYMQLIPIPKELNDQLPQGVPKNKWFVPLDMELPKLDSTGYKLALEYFTALDQASENGRYGQASDALKALKDFQRSTAKDIVPDEDMVNMEIRYNKMNIYKNTWHAYFGIGALLMIMFFVRILLERREKLEKFFKQISRVMFWLSMVLFLYHGYGIYMRWMISGHAPWSDAYEAVVFISWVVVLLGLIFSKKHGAILAGTLILATLMLFVSEMNLLDPEITPLQPVLKSYWLMIHVAIITGSYAPLGISCILSLLNIILYILRNKSNGERLTINISQITYVSEMAMMIGVTMLTIGTFLGGIWANESWGRYWGWDPKETWALVGILTYAVILHFRFIPGLKGKFAFNVAGFWGYSTILFTFFGVNFYLVGLHSYAQGDGLGKFPFSILVTAFLFLVLTVVAGIRQASYKKQLRNE